MRGNLRQLEALLRQRPRTTFTDLVEAGIIDPSKVVRIALQKTDFGG